MTISSVSYYKVVSDANLYYAIPCPSAARLLSLRATTTGSAFTLGLYNRAFTAAAVNLQSIVAGGTKTQLLHTAPHNYREGDQVTVASTTVSGYHTLHVVSSVVDPLTVITDQTYSADARGGTSTLAIASAHMPLYEIIETTASATVQRLSFTSVGESPVIINMDPPGTVGQPKQIYAKFSAGGTYRITLALDSE